MAKLEAEITITLSTGELAALRSLLKYNNEYSSNYLSDHEMDHANNILFAITDSINNN